MYKGNKKKRHKGLKVKNFLYKTICDKIDLQGVRLLCFLSDTYFSYI